MTIDLGAFGQGGSGIGDVPLTRLVTSLSRSRLVSANTTNATLIKGAPGFLYSINITNTSAGQRFVKMYDKATAPTVGTDTPGPVFGPPTLSTVSFHYPNGIPFTLGIGFGIVNLGADSDTTAPAAGDVIVDFVFA